MRHPQVLTCLCALLFLSLGSCALREVGDPITSNLHVIGMWEMPRHSDDFYRSDGEGPFPPSWPVFAIVGQSLSQAAYDSALREATFFLVAGPGLGSSDPLSRLISNTRFATHCNARDLRGRWIRFPKAPELFVLVYESGGTGGYAVRVFEHSLGFGVNYRFQDHTFWEVFSGMSDGTVYIGDVTGDGDDELLLRCDTTFHTSSDGDPGRYEILQWKDGQIAEIGEMDEDSVEEMEHLKSL